MPDVIVPWRGGCPHRERAFGWVRTRYEEVGWPVTVAAGGEPWIKSEAVMPAAEASSADVLVIADADVWTDGLPEAVRAVEVGAAWAKPHRMVHRLTEEATEKVLAGADWKNRTTEEKPYRGIAGGGVVVVRRKDLLDVPMDPRFVGWGQEDISLALALNALVGTPYICERDLVHLWHPPQPRLTRRYGSLENKRLLKRYIAAKRKPAEMRALIEEIHARRPDESNLLGGPPVSVGD